MVLTGTEVKSLRSGKASIKEAYARSPRGEVFLEGMNITPYAQGNRYNHEPVRSRKLLLHRREIDRLIGAVEREGPQPDSARALLPARATPRLPSPSGAGKKQHDKRQALKRAHGRAGDGARHRRRAAPVIAALAPRPRARGARSAPAELVVTTPRGETRIDLSTDRRAGRWWPPVPLAAALGGALGGRSARRTWADGGHFAAGFPFLVGCAALPAATTASSRSPLPPHSVAIRSSFPPVRRPRSSRGSWAERLPVRPGQRTPGAASAAPPPPPAASGPNGSRTGCSRARGDGGRRARRRGSRESGPFFPAGVTEKDVTLQVALLLRDELRRQGVGVIMTRTTDTLIALGDRAPYCADDCDLFVSLHVNSLARRAGYTGVRGFDTYFLGEAKTEEADRVARMENDAIRYEAPSSAGASAGGLDFILRDLQVNEYLRESRAPPNWSRPRSSRCTPGTTAASSRRASRCSPPRAVRRSWSRWATAPTRRTAASSRAAIPSGSSRGPSRRPS